MNQRREPFLPDPPASIHMVGIGGVGVSGLARILVDRGYTVSGSDLVASPVLDELRRLGVAVQVGHHAEHLGDADLVVTTAAAKDDNPELVEAGRRGVPIVKRARLLGDLAAQKVCLAVAGSHGKSTTSGMLAYVLRQAGVDPSYAVGAVVRQLGANAGPGDGAHFVVEADEYDYSFLTLRPDIALVTNVEHDHPDLFPDLASIDEAFERFVSQIKPGGTLIISADDPGTRRLQSRVASGSYDIGVVTVGRATDAAWRLDDGQSPAVLYGPDNCMFRLELGVPGHHNRMNAAMVFVTGWLLDVDPCSILDALRRFEGVGRRFELKGEAGGVRIFDDYAHHPTEIAATISATREWYPDGRIWAVFQPHTYSRTKQLLNEFARALDTADRSVLLDIYPARETDDFGVSSNSIAERMIGAAPVYHTPEDAAVAIADEVRPGDIVLILGAGDIWKAAPVLLESLTAAHATQHRTQESETGKYG